MSNKDLIENIRKKAIFYLDSTKRDERVLDAMLRVDRIDFLPYYSKPIAYEDTPAPIGYNQTCSQPSMVAFILDKLEIKSGNKILEIGSGCGYALAIASLLCKPDGFIYGIEYIKELVDFSRMNLAPYMDNIQIIHGDGSIGLKQYSPFDRIFISAGVSSGNFNEKILIDQLTDNGILIYPESYGNLYKIKKQNNKIYKEIYYGVSFVPLKGENS